MTAPRSVPASIGAGGPQSALAERRRSRRRQLQVATEVSLRSTESDAEWAGAGVLLNASGEGIACRMATQAANALTIGQTLHVVFRIGPASTVFELQARISNITPAGTTQSVVLGMEFVAGGRLKNVQTKLLESLRRAGDEAN